MNCAHRRREKSNATRILQEIKLVCVTGLVLLFVLYRLLYLDRFILHCNEYLINTTGYTAHITPQKQDVTIDCYL